MYSRSERPGLCSGPPAPPNEEDPPKKTKEDRRRLEEDVGVEWGEEDAGEEDPFQTGWFSALSERRRQPGKKTDGLDAPRR
jgi:hypothetical protein